MDNTINIAGVNIDTDPIQFSSKELEEASGGKIDLENSESNEKKKN